MSEPVHFPVERTAPLPNGYSIRYGISDDAGKAGWIIRHKSEHGVYEIGRCDTQAEAERFVVEHKNFKYRQRPAATQGETQTVHVRRTVEEAEPQKIKAAVTVEKIEFPPIKAAVRTITSDGPQTIKVAVRKPSDE